MERAWPFVLSTLGLVVSACTGDVVATSSQAAGSTGSAAAGSGAGGAGGAGSTGGAGSGGALSGLSGHYMQQTIGNCINFEQWLSFDAPPAFTHTDVDRDFCGSHSVVPAMGTYKVSGAALEMAWSTAKSSETRRFTHV